jgi:quercetin dioxygenase-like cupin family protein
METKMRIEKECFEKGSLLKEEAIGLPPGTLGTGRIWRKSIFEGHNLDLKVVFFCVEPGGRIPLHLEYNDEIFLVQSGKMTAWDKEEEYLLNPGEATLTLAGEYHAFRNDTNEDLILLVIYHGDTHHPPTLG